MLITYVHRNAEQNLGHFFPLLNSCMYLISHAESTPQVYQLKLDLQSASIALSLSIASSSIVVVRSDPPELQFNGVKVISQEQGHNTEDGDGRLPPGPRCPQRLLWDLRRARCHRPEPGARCARGGGLDRLQGRRHSRFLLLHKVQTEISQ